MNGRRVEALAAGAALAHISTGRIAVVRNPGEES
jgi:hypothetical protein